MLIRASWSKSPERRERLLARLLRIIAYHQANIADARESHAKKRKEQLRTRGVAPETCISCCQKVAL
ncbi:MAG: hypothetical protein FJ255_08385 [Phycisphaerae bacterium]|nr:hypothetical protein [Phycisphaerae bacterium]